MDGARTDDRMEHLRIPPQSVEAEQAVLGGLMLSTTIEGSARVWDSVADLLDEGSFYRRDHQLIWRALKHMHTKQRPMDAVTVGEFLEARGFADQVAGGAYLIELASTTPSAANIRAYAEIVADKALRRALIEKGTRIIESGYESGTDTVEIVGQAQSELGSLMQSQPCDLESIAPVMQRVFDRVTDRFNRGAGIDGVTCGLDDLDKLLNGLKPGLYLLAARPKMGKTTLAQNIAEHVALVRKQAVAVFSFEMQPEELGDRMLSSIGDVEAGRVRRGDLDEVDWGNVTAAMRRLRGAQLFVSRPKHARVEHVAAQARRQHARTPLGLIVIDYLQLMQTSGDNRAQAIGDITRELKLLSGEIGVPILLLSQLNRKLEDRTDKRPIPADLRDSGSIEQDADAVIFIYRDEAYHPDSRFKGTAEIIVALQRNGPADTVRVRYRPDRFRFENLPEDWEPEAPPPKEQKARRGMRKGGNPAADAAAGEA